MERQLQTHNIKEHSPSKEDFFMCTRPTWSSVLFDCYHDVDPIVLYPHLLNHFGLGEVLCSANESNTSKICRNNVR